MSHENLHATTPTYRGAIGCTPHGEGAGAAATTGRLASALVLAVLLSSCGSGTSTPQPESDRIALLSLSALDGDVWNTSPPTLFQGDPCMLVGVTSSGFEARAFATFDLTQLRPTDTIDAAGIRFYEDTTPGDGSPHALLGTLFAEVVHIGPTLDRFDFSNAIAPGTRPTPVGTDLVADVRDALQHALATGQTTLTVRLRFFGAPGGPSGNFLRLATGEHGSIFPAEMLVDYVR